ncbi:MAG: formate transporter FocA [Anaerolineae bacterium]|nr:formate transporter FocA [Anaerolineae bacterium]
MNNNTINIDAILPNEMASRAETVGVKKANLAFLPTLLLSILAGAFIAIGAFFSTTVIAGANDLPYGIVRFLAGLSFSIGLILVVVGGAELFTGNNLIVMAFTSGKVSAQKLLRNWVIVYLGNMIGAVLTALLMFVTRQYTFGNGTVGLTALNIAKSKTGLDFVQALALGIMCNALVCLAVWLCFSARTTTDKILAIIFPITAFVACGFEHSVANMYFIPIGIFIRTWGSPQFFEIINKQPADFSTVSWANFFGNLVPVTIGNIIGGAFMVGLVYWFIYLREKRYE